VKHTREEGRLEFDLELAGDGLRSETGPDRVLPERIQV
tara:strand:+ start:1513 stop:1626 length:114 start_codon:yes stop_codon:yes gene_type:complete